MKTKKTLLIILTIAFFSYGFDVQWPWMQKKEVESKKNQPAPVSDSKKLGKAEPDIPKLAPAVQPEPASESSVQADAARNPTGATAPEGKKSDVQSNQPTTVTEIVVKGTEPTLNPDAEIVKVQQELTRVVQQTKAIQMQSQTDRARLQKIMEQVEIQKRLLNTLKAPKPIESQLVVNRPAVNTEEILRNTKIRLLADEVRRTRESLQTVPKIPAAPQSSAVVQTLKLPKKNST